MRIDDDVNKRAPLVWESCKTDMKVNETKFSGVVTDNKIEGVGEGRTVACLPAASGEQGGHGRQSAATVCLCFRSGGDLNTVAGIRMHMFPTTANCRRVQTAVEANGARRFTKYQQ